MTPQAIIGLVMIVLGYALKIAAGAGWLPGDAGVAGEITGLGWALVGKELWPGSPQSLAVKARASKVPPPFTVAIVFACIGLAALSGCAGTPDPREALEGAKRAQESLEHVCAEIDRAKALREGVTDALDDVAGVAPAGVDGGAPAEVAPVQQPEAAPVTQ